MIIPRIDVPDFVLPYIDGESPVLPGVVTPGPGTPFVRGGLRGEGGEFLRGEGDEVILPES